MGLYDYYEADPPIECPKCGGQLEGWVGSDGHPFLFVWRQGVASPIDHRVDMDFRVPPESLAELRLPTEFAIHGGECECGYRFHGVRCDEQFELRCGAADGVWTTCEINPAPTPANDVGDGWIQCSECCDVWSRDADRRLYLCPGCGNLTRLSDGRPLG